MTATKGQLVPRVRADGLHDRRQRDLQAREDAVRLAHHPGARRRSKKSQSTPFRRSRKRSGSSSSRRRRNKEMEKWVADMRKDLDGETTYQVGYKPPDRRDAHRRQLAERDPLADALLDLQRLTERLRRDCPGIASRRRGRSSRTPSRRHTRSRTPRSPVTTRSSTTSSATCSSRRTSSRCCSRSGVPATSNRLRAGSTRSSFAGTRTSSARSRPNCRARPRELGADQGRAGEPRGDLPPRAGDASGAALRAEAAAARRRGRLRVPGRRRARWPISTTSCASFARRLPRRASRRPRPSRTRTSSKSSATSCSPPSTSRGG